MLPRRIPDYPDAYTGWNAVSSFGSIISLVATVLFIYIVYNIFVNKNFSPKNPWQIVSYFFGLNQFTGKNTLLIEKTSSNTIEWNLGSPIALHAYNTLPIQS